MPNYEIKIQRLVEKFTRDFTRLLNQSVTEALKNVRIPKAKGKPNLRLVKGGREAELEYKRHVYNMLFEVIEANPGKRLEELAQLMEMDSKALRPFAKKLFDDKLVRRSGQARGTTYTVR